MIDSLSCAQAYYIRRVPYLINNKLILTYTAVCQLDFVADIRQAPSYCVDAGSKMDKEVENLNIVTEQPVDIGDFVENIKSFGQDCV